MTLAQLVNKTESGDILGDMLFYLQNIQSDIWHGHFNISDINQVRLFKELQAIMTDIDEGVITWF